MAQVMKRVRLVNPSKRRSIKRLRTLGRKYKSTHSMAGIVKQAVRGVRLAAKKRKNPAKRRKLTAKQILFFGTKRQKASLLRRNPSRTKTAKAKRRVARSKARTISTALWGSGITRNKRAAKAPEFSTRRYAYELQQMRRIGRKLKNPKRRKNIGEIITIGLNPGIKRRRRKVSKVNNMARKRTRKVSSHRRRRRNPMPIQYRSRVAKRRSTHRKKLHYKGRTKKGTYSYMLNPRRRRKVARRGNPGFHRRKRYTRRRNPGFMSNLGGGTLGMVGGLIGGAIVTNFISNQIKKYIPAAGNGVIGIATTIAASWVAGIAVGKVFKNPTLAKNMKIGGMLVAALQAVNTFAPGIMGYSPLGLKGLGVLTPSSFYLPQVNQPNSMTDFVRPGMVPAPVPVARMKGLGMDSFVGARMGRIA